MWTAKKEEEEEEKNKKKEKKATSYCSYVWVGQISIVLEQTFSFAEIFVICSTVLQVMKEEFFWRNESH